jgi:PA-IL-like protein
MKQEEAMRNTLMAAALAAFAAIAVAASQPATLVLKSGERISGQMTSPISTSITLEVNGQPRSIPLDQVAIVAFEPGDPAASELNQLPTGANQNMVVMRDGSVVHAKLDRFSLDGSIVTIVDTAARNSRRDIPANQVARVYLEPAAARQVYASVLNSAPASASVGTGGVGTGRSITVNANQPWTDTGITVNRGDSISFRATGQIRISRDNVAQAFATPDGSASHTASRDRYPLPTNPVGTLIGRVGQNGPVFAIGSSSRPITMSASGPLFLGINDDGFSDNSGSFTVTIAR